jgi:redox-sensing transcriptional repressor
MDDFPAKQKEYGVTIGVITVPVDKAQEVTEQIIAGGIKALWNFTPFRIRVPENIVVHNTSMYAHLAVMFNRLNS